MYDGQPVSANLIDPAFCEKVSQYFFESMKNGNPFYRLDGLQVINSPVLIDDPNINKVMKDLRPYVEECFGKPMLPTYSCMRLYRKGDALACHRDREACEYSISVLVGRSTENPRLSYPLYFKMPSGTEISASCYVGDGVFYKGCETPHFRYPCPHDWYLTVFFHYVERGGEIYKSYYDKHPNLDRLDICHLHRRM